MSEAIGTFSSKVSFGKVYALEKIYKFFAASIEIPRRFIIIRKLRQYFFKAYAIRARIFAVFSGKGKGATGYSALRRLGKFAYGKVAVGNTHIVGLAAYQISGCFNARDKRLAHVTDMHDRPPRSSVAFNFDLAGSIRAGYKIIENNIAAKHGTCAKDRRGPHAYNGKIITLHFFDLLLGL